MARQLSWGGGAVPREREHAESTALRTVLRTLQNHPGVAWVERMNSGAARIGSRFVRFGFKGCPDLLGQLKDGRLLGVEVKAASGRLGPDQTAVLDRISAAGGVAFVARNEADVIRELDVATSSSGT